MAKRDYSSHQQSVIRRYYDNLDAIMLQKLQELVTELFLADRAGTRAKLWLRVEKAMTKLEVPPTIVQEILARKSAENLAKHVADWLAHTEG